MPCLLGLALLAGSGRRPAPWRSGRAAERPASGRGTETRLGQSCRALKASLKRVSAHQRYGSSRAQHQAALRRAAAPRLRAARLAGRRLAWAARGGPARAAESRVPRRGRTDY